MVLPEADTHHRSLAGLIAQFIVCFCKSQLCVYRMQFFFVKRMSVMKVGHRLLQTVFFFGKRESIMGNKVFAILLLLQTIIVVIVYNANTVCTAAITPVIIISLIITTIRKNIWIVCKTWPIFTLFVNFRYGRRLSVKKNGFLTGSDDFLTNLELHMCRSKAKQAWMEAGLY